MVCIQVSLCELPVLLIDCQATGANPVKGHLLEIGWMETRAIDITQNDSKRISTENHLVRQPELAVIPARIGKITGIKDTDFEKAEDPQEITDLLVSKANQLLQKGRLDHCPTVIHFARYEKAFLHDLCGKYGYDPKLFNIICSHEISKRLLAGLPRRGLRALAGFIGISVPEARRTHHHLIATAHIWARMVRLLENEVGIQSLEDLQNWLKESVPPKVSKREFLLDSKIRLDLPDSPGVYRMLRSNGDILYIGKATSLKRRVNSYFHQRSGVADHILEMLTQAKDLRVTPTVTPLEAALLESD